ncbi:MAG: sigma-70 family RNA polymerase sigma factor [Bacteroidales bacterium]|nr:sigma-70 family RNA polymerase sigma factor [Bacteroidales bacterium]
MEVTSNLSNEKSIRDYELVRKARENGDEQAYASLMSLYREQLYLMLLRMTNDPTEADDLTIEAFGKAFRSLNSYTPTHAFSTWLFTIASNNCIDFIRRKRMQTVSLESLYSNEEHKEYEIPVPSADDNPEERVIRRQRIDMLRDVVRQLKPNYRTLVEMRYYEEMSYEEIAKATNLGLSTVKVRLFRARDLLHNILANKQENL